MCRFWWYCTFQVIVLAFPCLSLHPLRFVEYFSAKAWNDFLLTNHVAIGRLCPICWLRLCLSWKKTLQSNWSRNLPMNQSGLWRIPMPNYYQWMTSLFTILARYILLLWVSEHLKGKRTKTCKYQNNGMLLVTLNFLSFKVKVVTLSYSCVHN